MDGQLMRLRGLLAALLAVVCLASPAWAVFPATAILDSCVRADENPISNGGKWTTTFFVATHAVRIHSNECQDNTGFRSESYWNNASFGPNGEVYVTTQSPVSTVGEDFYLAYRVGSPGATMTGYLADFALSSGGGVYVLNLYSVVAGVPNVIIAAFTVTIAASDVIGMSYIGDVHTLYQNGSALTNVTDSTTGRAAGAGFVGLGINNPTLDTASFANFGGGTLASGVRVRHRSNQSLQMLERMWRATLVRERLATVHRITIGQ